MREFRHIFSLVVLAAAIFAAPRLLAQNTFVRITVNPPSAGGRILVDGRAADMFTDSADPQPLSSIPDTGRLLVDARDNRGMKRFQVESRDTGGKSVRGIEVQAPVSRDRPNDVRVPGLGTTGGERAGSNSSKTAGWWLAVTTNDAGVNAEVFVNDERVTVYSDASNARPLGSVPTTRQFYLNLGKAETATLLLRGSGATAGSSEQRVVRLGESSLYLPVEVEGGGWVWPVVGIVLAAFLGVLIWLVWRELSHRRGGGERNVLVPGWPPSLSQKCRWLVPESKLAVGGMGTVFAVRNNRMRRRSVVKVLHPQLSDADCPEARRFLDEAHVLEYLEGSQIAPRFLSMTQETPGPHATLWFEMEYLDSNEWHTLRHFIGGKAGRVMAAEEVQPIMSELIRIIAQLHSRGVVHRDLSPENIMLMSRTRKLSLLDFGIVRWRGQTYRDGQVRSEHLTAKGENVGKPRYCAPEQWFDGLAAAGEAADWYSVGVICWEMVTGRPPYDSPEEARQGAATPNPKTLTKGGVASGIAHHVVQLLDVRQDVRLAAAAELYRLSTADAQVS